MSISAGNQHNQEFKIREHLEMLRAEKLLEEIDTEYAARFGRSWGGALESYRAEDAEVLLLSAGSICGTLRFMVDALREQGHSVGLLKLRMVRPFPTEALAQACAGARVLGVLEKDLSFGYEGTLFTNINSALHQKNLTLRSFNFIGGLGGRDITRQNVEEMVSILEKADAGTPTIHYLNGRCPV
jgi:pyruvate ferredoxin oxidoreductase alpha subunit